MPGRGDGYRERMDAFKWALVVFLALAVTLVIVKFVGGVRTNGLPVRRSSSHFGQVMGAMPPTPRPDRPGEQDGENADGPAR